MRVSDAIVLSVEIVEFPEAGPEVALVMLVKVVEEFGVEGTVWGQQFGDDLLQEGRGRGAFDEGGQ